MCPKNQHSTSLQVFHVAKQIDLFSLVTEWFGALISGLCFHHSLSDLYLPTTSCRVPHAMPSLSHSLGLLIIPHSCSALQKRSSAHVPEDKARSTSYSFPTNSVWTDLRKTLPTYGSAWPGIVWFFCSSVRPHLFSILKTRSVQTWKQPGKALVIFHRTVTSQWPNFSSTVSFSS